MDRLNKDLNSCIMIAAALHTPVGLDGIFKKEDLTGTGIELDSHVTLLYATGTVIPRENISTDSSNALGEEDSVRFLKILKEKEFEYVFDHFRLDIFENDSDFVILKMQEGSEYYDYLVKLNTFFRQKYSNAPSDYTYTPHLTLANVESGKGADYLGSETLKAVLRDSMFRLEDLIISFGETGEKDKDKFNVTTFHAIDRFFREESLMKSINSLEE